ncbi:MAG: hypothetical protein QOE28_1865 [Solirubrobacteraceae bacterium]|nr:hypothetical protein [Solirubrobacteraceae bacterium]
MTEEPDVREGRVEAALREEWPGLRLAWSAFDAVPGRSPPELRARLRLMSDRFRGPQAIELRRQPIPQAFRVFYRHIGLEPDETRTPVEALAVERMQHGAFRSRSLIDDAITVAVMDTGLGVWALDAAALDGEPVLRTARGGEALGSGEAAVRLPEGRLVVADAAAPLAVLFGDVAPAAAVTRATRSIVLFAVAVPGVPGIHLEEALWTVWDIVAG